jgi:methylthioribose-1-phosphate isomerase
MDVPAERSSRDNVNRCGDLRPVQWTDGQLRLLDQTLLPHEERWVDCFTVTTVAEAIQSMRVRGAPAIGLATAAGMAIAARQARETGDDPRAALEAAAGTLSATRPTAVNLRWAIEQSLQAVQGFSQAAEIAGTLDQLVTTLIQEQDTQDRAMGALGAGLWSRPARVLTHCNTGALASGGYGTALGVIRTAHARGNVTLVYADESRPRLQGARLTAWELDRYGIPYRMLPDSAASALMARGLVDLVIVGADRIAANGDVANKIGTYQVAIAASCHGLPFYVAAPCSTIDPRTPSGAEVPIEERDEDEVLQVGSERLAPKEARAVNLAFDVTPARLITAIVTDRGVLRPPYGAAIARLLTPEVGQGELDHATVGVDR